MNKTRLEAFSDGVLAIIITIMVLEKLSAAPQRRFFGDFEFVPGIPELPAILAHQNNERIFYFTIQNAKQTIN